MEFINDLLSTTAGIIGSLIVIFGAVTVIVKYLINISRRIKVIYTELTPNGGGSLKDSVNRIESKMFQIEALQLSGLTLTGKAFWLSDATGKCTFASIKLSVLMGVTPDQILGWGWVSAIAMKDREACRTEWVRCVKDLREFHMIFHYVHSDGTEVKVRGNAVPVVHAENPNIVVGMIGWAEVI